MSENETQFKRTGAVPAGSRQLKVLLSMNEPDAGTHANANLHRFTIIMSAAGILGLTPRRRMSLM